jgi:hypothetical protein
VDISQNKSEFIDDILSFRTEIQKSLEGCMNMGDLEEKRSEYQGKFSKERFKDYFVKKTTLHIVFKYILIRMSEDLQRIVNPKFSIEGIRNWNEMSKNYRKDYYMLFNIASEDIRRTKELGEIFTPSIYDNYIEKLQRSVFNKKEDNHIEVLKEYDFRTLDPNTAVSLFDKLYPSEDRENLQGFLEDSKVITYLMKSLGLI